jgi:hypothetical protein
MMKWRSYLYHLEISKAEAEHADAADLEDYEERECSDSWQSDENPWNVYTAIKACSSNEAHDIRKPTNYRTFCRNLGKNIARASVHDLILNCVMPCLPMKIGVLPRRFLRTFGILMTMKIGVLSRRITR